MAVVRREGQSQTATFRTKSEAQKWAAVIEARITEGKYLPPSASKQKSVRDLMQRYIANVIPKQKDQRNPRLTSSPATARPSQVQPSAQ